MSPSVLRIVLMMQGDGSVLGDWTPLDLGSMNHCFVNDKRLSISGDRLQWNVTPHRPPAGPISWALFRKHSGQGTNRRAPPNHSKLIFETSRDAVAPRCSLPRRLSKD